MGTEYERGYEAGFSAGYHSARRVANTIVERRGTARVFAPADDPYSLEMVKPKRKKPQKGKAKLLTTMTKKKWDKYKKGSGKKTYVEIRAQVSKTQDYKRACKRKGFK